MPINKKEILILPEMLLHITIVNGVSYKSIGPQNGIQLRR